jgi:hypothetical protein
MTVIERLDRVVQPLFWIQIPVQRQRIKYQVWPTFFLESRENGLLVGGRIAKLLHKLSADHQLTAYRVPMWNKPARSHLSPYQVARSLETRIQTPLQSLAHRMLVRYPAKVRPRGQDHCHIIAVQVDRPEYAQAIGDRYDGGTGGFLPTINRTACDYVALDIRTRRCHKQRSAGHLGPLTGNVKRQQ